LIAHSTIFQNHQRIAARIAPSGAHLIDAPFTGSKGAAEKGQLVYYVAADPAIWSEQTIGSKPAGILSTSITWETRAW